MNAKGSPRERGSLQWFVLTKRASDVQSAPAPRSVRHRVVDQQCNDCTDDRADDSRRLKGALAEVLTEDRPTQEATDEGTNDSEKDRRPTPIGSGPGTRKRATNPAIAPTMSMTMMNANMISPP